MVYKEHLIELWVNGNKVELEDQESLNLRLNNVLFNPTKISSTQADYSFEFEIPATPKNNTIFDYANNLSRLNKFHQRYNAEVYADGTVIFSGSLVITGHKDKKYTANLVSVKVYSFDEIFGDAVMSDIKGWDIDFDGAPTINQINAMSDTDVVFPLVSYGVFQKSPESVEGDYKTYTSKFDMDEYNRWYIEDFYPSHNMLATLKRAFEWKDYTVGGDVFTNNYLKEVFMSVNLADEQSPTYNLGNPKFGKVNLSLHWLSNGAGYVQSLKYPYYKIAYMGGNRDDEGGTMRISGSDEYNFSSVQIYDLLSEGTVSTTNSSYMYQPNEHVIVIPADGFYKIDMSMNNGTLYRTTNNKLTAGLNTLDGRLELTNIRIDPPEFLDVEFEQDLKTTTPLEIQLVRNYDDNLELIKGKYNLTYFDGNPNHDRYCDINMYRLENHFNYYSCYPHEKIGQLQKSGFHYGFIQTISERIAIPTNNDLCVGKYWEEDTPFGYVQGNTEIMAYNNAVSPIFICGFSTMGNEYGGGTVSVMKNGYSWSKQSTKKDEGFYKQDGYFKTQGTSASAVTSARTSMNTNTYLNSPSASIYTSSDSTNGSLHCLVYLNKDDKLQLLGVHRDYNTEDGEQVNYTTSCDINLTIEAISPDSYTNLRSKGFGYYSNTEFPTKLNIANFLNKEKKISEWVQNIVDAFNLEVVQNGNNIDFNIKKNSETQVISAVGLDDRVNTDEIESKKIDYPKSMAVKYKIDHDEWGFERSAVEAAQGDETVLDNDGWEKLADSGYTVIQLSDDSYETSTSDKNLQFSYTWYDDWKWYPVNSSFVKTSSNYVTLKLPCISKFSYMIDGYDYEESMKHDGYGLPQRFWFRPSNTNCYVWTRTYPPEEINVYSPTNLYTNYQDIYFNLSYKDSESSILTNFFNINAYLASNYIVVDVYLSASEYNRIKNGSLVHVDSDLYIPVEISGYDPSGSNPTELKLMKKVK